MQQEDLLAAIRADRDDPAPYLVYADWLLAHGDTLGELIVLSYAGTGSPEKRERLAALRAERDPPAKLAIAKGEWGLWRTLKLHNDDDWMNEAFDPLALARGVFARPICAALEKLSLGVLRWDHNHRDVPAVLAEAARHPWAAHLEALHLGDIDGANVDMAHHVVGDVGAVISASFPALTSLVIHSGEQNWRGEGETFGVAGLALPHLDRLVIETCSLSKERLVHLLAAELPELTDLELWFGSQREGADCTVVELAPLLDGRRFATVLHLGLRNSELADELGRVLPVSKIAARLESLDLSMGTMTDEGAIALAAGASSFPQLQSLNVDQNFIRSAGLDALRAAFREVIAETQKDDDDSIEGEIHRYVTVSE